VAWCGVIVLGCGGSAQDGPETVPLSGKVVFTKGGGSVASLNSRSASIEFQSVEQPEVRAFGSIAEDGSFTMATPFGEGGKPGVIKGRHRVRLTLDDEFKQLVAPQFLQFERSGITVTAPSEQPVEVKVWK
jgi:hypothetical protein